MANEFDMSLRIHSDVMKLDTKPANYRISLLITYVPNLVAFAVV